jgi:hypothetical protein
MKTEWDSFEEYSEDLKDEFAESLEEIKKKYGVETLFHEDGKVMTVESLLRSSYEQYEAIRRFEQESKAA